MNTYINNQYLGRLDLYMKDYEIFTPTTATLISLKVNKLNSSLINNFLNTRCI